MLICLVEKHRTLQARQNFFGWLGRLFLSWKTLWQPSFQVLFFSFWAQQVSIQMPKSAQKARTSSMIRRGSLSLDSVLELASLLWSAWYLLCTSLMLSFANREKNGLCGQKRNEFLTSRGTVLWKKVQMLKKCYKSFTYPTSYCIVWEDLWRKVKFFQRWNHEIINSWKTFTT